MTPTTQVARRPGGCCPCGRLDRPPCTRVGGDGECATTAPLYFGWTVVLGIRANTLSDAECLLRGMLGGDDWNDIAEHVAVYPPLGPPDDAVEHDDSPACGMAP